MAALQPKKVTKPEEEEDLNDLDDLLAEFNPAPLSKASHYSPSSSQVPSLPTQSASTTSTTTDDFPDPDSPTLTGVEGTNGDELEFTAEIQAGLSQLLGELGAGGVGGEEGDEMDFKRIMEELMKGDFAGMEGLAGGEGEDDPAALMAALAGLGAGSATKKGKSKSTTPSSPTASTSTSPPATFQETIAQTMNKMKASSDTVTSETAAKAANEMDPMASMMAKMAGLDPSLLGGDEEGLQGMLDEMMNQLMSKELLYEPLKELSEKYPAYLAENASTLSAADLTRYQKQKLIVDEIVAKFDEEGPETGLPLTETEEALKMARSLEVVELVGKMNDQGAPPKEIMGAMPPGMDGEAGFGMPAMPDCPVQ